MVWAKNGNTVGSGSTSVSLTFDASLKFNQILSHSIESAQNQEFQFNSDTATNYSRRWQSNGGEYTQTSIDGSPNAGTSPSFSVSYIINIATEEKLIITHDIIASTAGAGTAPGREEQYEKWSNTSAQITDITWKNESTSVNFTSSSDISALGTD